MNLRRLKFWQKAAIPAPAEGKQKATDFERAFLRYIETRFKGGGVTEPYKQHPYVYACVQAIAQNIAQVPSGFWKGENQVERPQVLDRLGNGLSWEDLVEAVFVHLGLSGNAFVWLDPITARERLVRLWPVDKIKPVIEGGILAGWRIRVGNSDRVVEVDEVVQWKYFNPYDSVLGLSPMEAAKGSVDQDYWASQFNEEFFKNSAEPGGILNIEDNLPDQDYKRLLAQIEKRHKGQGNRHKMMLLDGGKATYTSTGGSHKDMEFLPQRKYSREEICAVFKVPPIEVGILEYANYSNGNAQMRQFWTKGLFPKMTMFESIVNRRLLPRLNLGDLRFYFDRDNIPDLAFEFDAKVESAEKLVGLGFSPQEVSEKFDLGFEPDKRREVILVSSSLVPIENVGKAPAAAPEPGKSAKAKGADPAATRIWEKIVAVAEDLEREFQPAVKRYFYDLRKAILAAVEAGGGTALSGISWDQWDALLAEKLGPLYPKIATAGAAHALETLGVTFSLEAAAPLIAQVANDRLMKVKTINQTIKTQVN